MHPLWAVVLLQVAHAADLLWSADLAGDDGDLISYGQTGQWEWGDATTGPKGGYDGGACWATQLAGWYLNDSEDHLELPELPLSGAVRPVLALQHWYRFQDGDLGCIEVEQGGAWIEIAPIYGYPVDGGYDGVSDDWLPAWVDLGGLVQGESLRFTIRADGAGADLGWYLDEIALWDGDVVPPRVEIEACLEDSEDLDGDYVVQAAIRDNVELNTVLLAYSVDGGTEHRIPMSLSGGDTFEAGIPGQDAGTTVSYLIEASDGENTTVAPEIPCSFEVRLPAPTQLQGPDGVVYGDTAFLSWEPPESSHTVLGYRVYRDDHLQLELELTQDDLEVVTGEQTFEVSALYAEGEGSRSEALVVRAAVPALLGLEPDEGYQGDNLRLRLEGEYLLMAQDDLLLDLGEGVQVTGYDVRDVDLAFVTIAVAASATAGLRDLSVTSGDYELIVADAFEILPGSERPQLTGLEPDSVRQGDETELVISASQPFADQPSVWLGESVLVESVSLLEDDTLEVSIVVPYDTPLGLHALEVDDGVRIFSGPQLQVRDYIAPVDPDGNCSSVPGRAGWTMLLAGLLAVVARRRD